jgi:L-ascorbate metabolism protein UlaG (beta-lactamase superfamily)
MPEQLLKPHPRPRWRARACALAAALALLAPAAAQASVCQSLAQELPGARLVRLAALDGAAAIPAQAQRFEGEVTIRFIGHATYLLETGDGVTIATDYAGWSGAGIPRVVTMNHAHETHWTPFPDERIEHVFRGWNPEGGKAEHHRRIGDVLVRNVPTDIRSWDGGVEPFGNSIFIFEIGDLCVGHLGHLHHELTPEHYAAIGRLDVVMAAVDGGVTLNLPDMIALLKRVRASVVLPMHYWASGTLQTFLDGMSDDFRVVRAETPTIRLTPRTLPRIPSVYVLPQSAGGGLD